MPSKKIAERMYGNNGPRNSVFLRDGFLEKFLQGLPAATAEIGKELSVIEEIPAEDFGYAEDKMAVGYGLEDLFTEPFPEFHHSFLMTGWTEVAALA